MKTYIYISLILLLFIPNLYAISPDSLSDKEKKAASEIGITVYQLADLLNKRIFEMSPRDLNIYLDFLDLTENSTTKKVQIIAKKTIGQPYNLHLLGEYPFELHDAKGLVALDASDCMTFVEQTYSMALSYDWKSFFTMLQRIRYKNGTIGVEFRNHFTEYDWIPNNKWLVNDMTDRFKNAKPTVVKGSINRASFLKKWGVGQSIPTEKAEWNYIYKDDIPIIIPELKTGDMVTIVRGSSPNNVFVSHMGLLSVEPDGTVNLIHSGNPQVHMLPLIEYVKKWAPNVSDDVQPASDEEEEEVLPAENQASEEHSTTGGQNSVDAKKKKKHARTAPTFMGIKVLRLTDNPMVNLEKIDGPNAPKLTIYGK